MFIRSSLQSYDISTYMWMQSMKNDIIYLSIDKLANRTWLIYTLSSFLKHMNSPAFEYFAFMIQVFGL